MRERLSYANVMATIAVFLALGGSAYAVKRIEGKDIAARMKALQRIGDPYTDEQIANAPADVAGKTELDAVVAYLQGLGKHAPRGN